MSAKRRFTIAVIVIQIAFVFLFRSLRPDVAPFISEPHKILGNPEAKINLVVFSEILCPYCIKAHATLKKILEKYGNDIKVTYKHYLLKGNRPYNIKSTMAMECAGDQGKFWDYYERLTKNPSEWFDKPDFELILKSYAGELALNKEQFNTCFESNSKLPVIQANQNEGKAYLVHGTPTGYLNGKRIILNFNYEYLDSLIAQELKGKKP